VVPERQVPCEVWSGHFHWNANTTGCSDHGTGHFRLPQKQGNKLQIIYHYK